MILRPIRILASTILIITVSTSASETGLVRHVPGSFEGYTLIAPDNLKTTYLVDNTGKIVKTWESQYVLGLSVYLLENGHLLRCGRYEEVPGTRQRFGKGGRGGIVEEFDWDGSLIWSYRYTSDQHLLHHDIEPLPNGNILMIAWKHYSTEEAITAGRVPNALGEFGLCTDHIIEVKPTGSEGGEIVWQWNVWDHLIQQYDQKQSNYGLIAKHTSRINLNPLDWHASISAEERAELEALGYLANTNVANTHPNRPQDANPDWTHMNSIDYNVELDQIMVSVLGFNEIWVIDHSTSTAEAKGHTGGRYGKGGELLYRWGNPQVYGAGIKSDQRLFAQHDARWIEPGLPGEGNILVFNNGRYRPDGKYSTVIEIALPLNTNGTYDRIEGKSFGPAKPIWAYAAERKEDFYAHYLSGAQRLPNGNTFICSGVTGTLFEVTPGNKIVWKYISPVIPVFRSLRFGPDYSGLAHKPLVPAIFREEAVEK